MQNYELKITGSGTKSEIINSLLGIIRDLENPDFEVNENGTWEDPILYSTCTECEPFGEFTDKGECLDQ